VLDVAEEPQAEPEEQAEQREPSELDVQALRSGAPWLEERKGGERRQRVEEPEG